MPTIRTAILSVALTLVLLVAAYFAFGAVPARAASSSADPASVHMYTNEVLRQWVAQQNQPQEGVRLIGMPR